MSIPLPATEAPDGVVYCGGGKIKRQIDFAIKETKGKWNAVVTINGKSQTSMTAYSYFGKRVPPKAFAFALLLKDRGELLIFKDGSKDWLESGDYTYRKCD